MNEVQLALLLMLLFSIKHFLVDFPLQGPYQYLNKGTYGHPGGLLHAALHGAGTFAVLFCFASLPFVALMTAIDVIVHYHIDWAKMNLNKHFGWAANTSEKFWWLLGLDQLTHYITYVIIIACTVGII